MAFIINKIGPLYSGFIKAGIGDFINDNVRSITKGLFGSDQPQNRGVNLKIDSLSFVLKGDEKNAAVLEEYVPTPKQETSAFKQSSKNILNQDMSNLGGGRYFVFVEYRDDQQAIRGIRGCGNMILSTRGPIKFNGQQNLPDVSLPGAGTVVMDMGPADSYINFEGSFLFQSPDESIAWLENARLNGLAFVFHYKRWHRFVRIQRLSFDVINDSHIDFQIGLKVMGVHENDVNNIITSGKKKTRLERLSIAEMSSRSLAAIADAAAGWVGLNDIEDISNEFFDQFDRIGSFAVAAGEGLANSVSVVNDYVSVKASSVSLGKRTDIVVGNFNSDVQKYVTSSQDTIKAVNDAAEIARGIL
jgi:hypothetical protein